MVLVAVLRVTAAFFVAAFIVVVVVVWLNLSFLLSFFFLARTCLPPRDSCFRHAHTRTLRKLR